MPLLGLVVMGINLEAETNFLQLCVSLIATSVAGFHGCLVLVLSEVHEFTHRWACIRRDFDQIEVCFLRQSEGVFYPNDPNLFTIWSHETDLRNTDTFINTGLADVLLLTLRCDSRIA